MPQRILVYTKGAQDDWKIVLSRSCEKRWRNGKRGVYIPFVPRQSVCFGSKRRVETNHCDGSSPLFCRIRESRCPKGGIPFLASGGYKRYNTLDLASKSVCRGHLRVPRLLPCKGSTAPLETLRQQAAARPRLSGRSELLCCAQRSPPATRTLLDERWSKGEYRPSFGIFLMFSSPVARTTQNIIRIKHCADLSKNERKPQCFFVPSNLSS